ncbi:MAG TPA: DUF2188 domain-containing protein [Verrucomicrobiales bacterium]|jgi:hypothetical protein|nr:DUF2188 domain-containing protein [Verrucomicrobiales bacterium]
MKSYHLTPNGDTWELAEESGTSVATYENKDEAMRDSRQTVAEASGSLKIHRADGTIEEERTYPRSKDPAKSPG